jgi:hypothetical protein
MTAIPRPNRNALDDALAIYRDSMRPFLAHYLRRVPGKRLEEAIRMSLRGNQANQFDDNIRRGRSIEGSIDVNAFPELIRNNWRDVFSTVFSGDRVIQNRVSDIREIRNEVSHPEASDLDEEKTRAYFYMIADVLERINRPDAKASVEEIRECLFAPPQPEKIDSPVPRGKIQEEPHSPTRHNGRDKDLSARPIFRLKLGRTYYNQGFFNVTVAFDKFVRPDEGPVTLALDGYGEINAKVNRSANLNGTARVMGGKSLRDWFRRMHSEGDTVPVRIDTPYWMTLGVN